MSNSQAEKVSLPKWCNCKNKLILWLVRHSLAVFLGLGIFVTLFVLCSRKDLTALFTGLAFLGTIANLWYQGRQLARQQFENSFFRMLDQLRTMVDNIEFGQNWYRGKSVFKDCYYTLNKLYNLPNSDDSKKELMLNFKKSADYVLLNNYFDFFYQILKYIDNAPEWVVNKDQKKNYARMLKAHISKYEMSDLKYHLLCIEKGNEVNTFKDFIDMIKKYKMIETCEKEFMEPFDKCLEEKWNSLNGQ